MAEDATLLAQPSGPEPAAAPAPGRGYRVLGVLGELLLTAGVVVLLYVLYLLFGTGIKTAQAQDDLRGDLDRAWSQPAAEVAPPVDGEPPVASRPDLGDAFALLSSPALGADWVWVVQEGVGLATLARGPGRYPDSGLPGEAGVVAIAGHRATHGEPFAHLDRLRPGDEIQLEVRDGVYTYTVSETRLVAPSDTWVLAPQPGIERGLTLTTCHPRWGRSQRLIVWAEQADFSAKP